MALFELILPIFTVIFLGFFLKKGGLFDEAFVQVLNQLVYQVFLPVLVFWEISRAPFHGSFNPRFVIIIIRHSAEYPDFHGFHPPLVLGDWNLRWPLFA